MDLYKPLAKKIIIPMYYWKENSKIPLYLKEFENTQYLSPDELQNLRWEAQKKMVHHAYDTCPYYKKKYDEHGIHPSDLKKPADFEQIPILYKSEIQENTDDLISDKYNNSEIIEDFTGGSSGSPLKIYLNTERRESRNASMIRHDRWAGYDRGEKLALLWGATRDIPIATRFKSKLRNKLISRALYLDTSLITPETMKLFVDQLKSFKPQYILAYANSISLFAKYIIEKNLTGIISPRSIITSAEVLTREARKLVESTFNCPVFDRYGCREAGILSSECDKHEDMHINSECIHLEFVNNGNNVESGEMGKILLTDLLNFVMPLIRYNNGDMGIPSDKMCSCGRGLPLMQMAAGRVTDFIITAGKELVSGIVLSTYLITKLEGIKQVQFYQDRTSEIVVRYVPDPGFKDEDLRVMKKLIYEFLGDQMQVHFEKKDDIPKTRSGKFQFTISTLDPLEHLV